MKLITILDQNAKEIVSDVFALEEGMVFALEAFWPATDGWSAARIEEEVVVTKDGPKVITRFPAEVLVVAGRRYHSATGPLPATREAESHLNRDSQGIPAGIAGVHARE